MNFPARAVTPLSISELWVIDGREPVLWTVPIYVTWREDTVPLVGHVFHACELTLQQWNAFKHVIRQYANEVKDGWIIQRVNLEKIARYHAPADPETLVSWERPQLNQEPQFHPEQRVERDEFIDALWQKGVPGVRSRSDLDLIWKAFCEHSINWMINKEKPVDMYLFKLHISPYRVDWKEKLQRKFPKLGPMMSNAEYEDQQLLIFKGRTWEDLCSLDLIAVFSGLLQRHIEVEHRSSWWKEVRKVETQRRSVIGSIEYAKSIVGSLKRRAAVSIRLFVEWYGNLNRPSGVDIAGGFHGDYRLLAQFRKPRMPGQRRLKTPAAVEYGDCPNGSPAALSQTNGPLPALPPVQPETQDLRDSGGNDDRPAH